MIIGQNRVSESVEDCRLLYPVMWICFSKLFLFNKRFASRRILEHPPNVVRRFLKKAPDIKFYTLTQLLLYFCILNMNINACFHD